jgi:tetratricopeptide (TPR) repeat protein
LSLGLLDRAEALYRQVSAADPRNSIAVVGLARVSLERQNESEALELARRALAIDPENTAAQRMTRRLEEVLRYRGAVLPAELAATGSAEGPATEPEPAEPAKTEPEPTAETEPEPEPVGATEPEPESTAPRSAASPRRRSLVDRILRRE